MKTPIIDFVNSYANKNSIRLHMPGHKGKDILGFESKDITEIDGADVLYLSDGIIKESEANAKEMFDFPTFYSTEGSSLVIRAMLFLALTRKKHEKRPHVLALRNVHKTFITAASLLDFDVDWMYGAKANTYHSCIIAPCDLDAKLSLMKNDLPFAVYVTSPDYLGNILDIKGIADVCKGYDIPLIVDNAHGAYLKFLGTSLHPIDLGATMCSASAHKTLPALTGAAYMHIAKDADKYYLDHAKEALNMFASTSPSYLILESLDYTNKHIYECMGRYDSLAKELDILKASLLNNGYKLAGDEKLKITIDAKKYGYTGNEIASYLHDNNIECEFADEDFVVMMFGVSNTDKELEIVKEKLLALPKRAIIKNKLFKINEKTSVMTIREASFSVRERVNINDANGRILADTAVTCPPAVPIVVCGERIDESDIELFKYYGVEKCSVVKE